MWVAPGTRARRRAVAVAQKRARDIDLFAVGQEVRWIASMILEQAVNDLHNHVPYFRSCAREFILSQDFAYWAEMIDLDVDAAREALAQRLRDAGREE